MKNLFSLIAAILFFSACTGSATKTNDQQTSALPKTDTISAQRNAVPLAVSFTLTDAEKILGEPAHITDSIYTNKNNIAMYSYAYTANNKDNKTGKTGVIYYLVEEYPFDSSAHRVYTDIKIANQNHGIKELHDLGDEAYFHTDNENFYFAMVRKGTKMFRLKVNKITGNTSLDQFNLVTKDITGIL